MPEMVPVNARQWLKSQNVKVEAKCPKCGKMWTSCEVPWTGRGVPRLFCPPCRSFIVTCDIQADNNWHCDIGHI